MFIALLVKIITIFFIIFLTLNHLKLSSYYTNAAPEAVNFKFCISVVIFPEQTEEFAHHLCHLESKSLHSLHYVAVDRPCQKKRQLNLLYSKKKLLRNKKKSIHADLAKQCVLNPNPLMPHSRNSNLLILLIGRGSASCRTQVNSSM